MKILTIDLEEWFHCDSNATDVEWHNYEVRIYKNTDRILETLNEHGQKATFFCLGWIARTYPDILRKIVSEGHEIGCHSDIHELLTKFDKKEFSRDTERAIKSIEDATGQKIIMYRAPVFSITKQNKWAFEVLGKYGIEIDSSIFPSRRANGGFPEFGTDRPTIVSINGLRIKEFPMNTGSFLGRPYVFSGGGYFRFFPYWFLEWKISTGPYIMSYFHPRDFDDEQPVLDRLSLLQKMKSYYGLKGAFAKFNRVLADFRFYSMLEADRMYDWKNAAEISIQ